MTPPPAPPHSTPSCWKPSLFADSEIWHVWRPSSHLDVEQQERDRPIIGERVDQRLARCTAEARAPHPAYGPRKL